MKGVFTNLEGYEEYNINPDHWKNRKPGLSALVRLKDEEIWVEQSLKSILPWVDEVVCAIQPCEDMTAEIVDSLSSPKIEMHYYPFDSDPMGPGHDKCPHNSVYASAYYYNWTMAQSTYSHILKWDGDMVAMDWLGDSVRSLLDQGLNRIKIHGIDIVGNNLDMTGSHIECPHDGVSKVTQGVYWVQGETTQRFVNPQEIERKINKAFLHFKWARKPISSITKQWPENWHNLKHFQNIIKRAIPIAKYNGEYPSIIKEMLQ